jgi:hypothetical protein
MRLPSFRWRAVWFDYDHRTVETFYGIRTSTWELGITFWEDMDL